MDWRIEIFCCNMLTSVTGLVLTLVWPGIGQKLEKTGMLHIRYKLLQGVVIFYFIPFAYLFLKLLTGFHLMGEGTLFESTPWIQSICQIGYMFWMTGVATCTCIYIAKQWEMWQQHRGSYEASVDK